MHTPKPQPGVAGRSRSLSPNTQSHTTHPSQERRGTSGGRTQTHTHPNTPARSGGVQADRAHEHTQTPQYPSAEWRGAAETRAQAHTPMPHTRTRSAGVKAERAREHTYTPSPQPGVAGRSQNQSTSRHTHAAHHSQEWRGTSGARTQTGHIPTPLPREAGRTRNKSPNTHTHTTQPSQEWRVASGARTQTHTHTPKNKAAVAGRSQSPSPSTHTQAAQPSQEWQGTSGVRTHAQTLPNTPARTRRAQPKPQTKHTHQHHTTQPGVARYKLNAHTSTHTPKHPSQKWQGAAGARAQAHTRTPHTPARSGGVQAERHTNTHTHPNTSARSGGAQPKPEPKHTHPHRTLQPGVAGYNRSAHTNAHTQTPQPKNGGAQPKPEPKHTHPSLTPQPGVARYRRSGHTNTDTPEHPRQEWRSAAETRAQSHTPTPHTPARTGGVQAESANKHAHIPATQPGVAGRSRNPKPKHTHPRRTPQPGVAGYKPSAHTTTHTTQQPSQEWRGAAETRAQAHTPTPHTQARSGGVQAKRAHKHTQAPTHQPRVAGRSRNPSPSTHILRAHPRQERAHKYSHTPSPQPAVADRNQNPSASTTQTQTQAPHNSTKPSVHSLGTEAARAMQVTQPNEIRSPGVRLHPKASAALGLEAARVIP